MWPKHMYAALIKDLLTIVLNKTPVLIRRPCGLQAYGGPTNISVDVHGFSWQDEQLLHGFHVHERGRLGYRCLGAGGHFNPENTVHGGPDDEIR